MEPVPVPVPVSGVGSQLNPRLSHLIPVYNTTSSAFCPILLSSSSSLVNTSLPLINHHQHLCQSLVYGRLAPIPKPSTCNTHSPPLPSWPSLVSAKLKFHLVLLLASPMLLPALQNALSPICFASAQPPTKLPSNLLLLAVS